MIVPLKQRWPAMIKEFGKAPLLQKSFDLNNDLDGMYAVLSKNDIEIGLCEIRFYPEHFRVDAKLVIIDNDLLVIKELISEVRRLGCLKLNLELGTQDNKDTLDLFGFKQEVKNRKSYVVDGDLSDSYIYGLVL